MFSADKILSSNSFLEYAFLKYVLGPATRPSLTPLVHPQHQIQVGDQVYFLDYLLNGERLRVAIELDGYAFHSDRQAFSYDRLRQNDLQTAGLSILRFSYDNIRNETGRCIRQLQALMRQDPALRQHLEANVHVPVPQMDPSPLYALQPSPRRRQSPVFAEADYFALARRRLNVSVLRNCQLEALQALVNYFGRGGEGGQRAACVMAVGSGKTVLGITAAIAFSRRRAMIVTPASVIRRTFDRALDPHVVGNALHHLPSGPLLSGVRTPRVLVLDRGDGSIRSTPREQLLAAELIVTNYHTLGDGRDPGDLLAKLRPDDVDFLIIDEAHIAAAPSYQRLFQHFRNARAVLMSACFRRLDGKPIEADVVYRYRLVDAIGDGVAKKLMVHRHVADPEQTVYEVAYADGMRREVVGKDALLAIIEDERKLPSITAKSLEPIRQVMAIVRKQLDVQTELLHPIRPRVLFAALGEQHAAQIAQVAQEFGIPAVHLHHSMGESIIRRRRARFERESGDLQGLVHLRMLGEGYDFPPITIVVPMRPYGSFAEFYQFIGRGVRVIRHPALRASRQVLDVVFHSELGLEEHLDELREENDMEPWPMVTVKMLQTPVDDAEGTGPISFSEAEPGPQVEVLVDHGSTESSVLHSDEQIRKRQQEREQKALAAAYARYVESSPSPISFEQFVQISREMRNE